MTDLLSHEFWEWALDKGTVSAAKSAVKMAVTGAIAVGTFVLTQALRSRGSVQASIDAGSTVQSPQILVTGFACGLVSLGILIWGIVDPATLEEPGAGIAWMILIGGFTSGFVVMSVYAAHRWTWNEDALMWEGAFRRERIPWDELASVGTAWDGQFVAKAKSGRKIRWTTYALEHDALTAAIRWRLKQARETPT
jgi:hypothetical protein